jgi:hypothetical protein
VKIVWRKCGKLSLGVKLLDLAEFVQLQQLILAGQSNKCPHHTQLPLQFPAIHKCNPRFNKTYHVRPPEYSRVATPGILEASSGLNQCGAEVDEDHDTGSEADYREWAHV